MMDSRSVRHERRCGSRTAAIVPVALEAANKGTRQGVTRDVSETGVLIVTRSQFARGDRLKITLQPNGRGNVDIVGRVVRVDEHPVSSPELWRYRVGIAFEAPLERTALLE